MKKTVFLFLILSLTSMVFAQKELKLMDIEMINLGDGQEFAHVRGDRDKPIDGKVRLISGVTEEYIDAEFSKGYPTGTWNYYERNRLKVTLIYKDGYFDGPQTLYFGNGEVERQASFKKGKKDGEWLHYSSSGNKRSKEIFKDNSMTKTVTYYTNENIDTERNFKEGKEHGITKSYSFEGDLKSEKNFTMGKQVGKQLVYISSNMGSYIATSNYNEKGREDGAYQEVWADSKKLKVNGQYTDGKKEGKWVFSNTNGKTYKEEIYKNGSLQDSKKID